MLNKVMLIGNLGKDPEVRHLESGATVAKFSIATNESYKDKSGEWQTLTEWHDIVMWRATAERAERLLSKGKQVYIEGKLTHRKYQDKDGNDRFVTEVVAYTFHLLEKRESSTTNDSSYFPTEDNNIKSASSSSMLDSGAQQGTTPPADDDDLPF